MTYPGYNAVLGGTMAQDIVNEQTAFKLVSGASAHIMAPVGNPPAAAAGANNGTTPPAPVVSSGSTDSRGSITFGSGATPAAGVQVAVTFALPYVVPPVVVLSALNAATQALGLFVISSPTGFTVSTSAAPGASQANTVYSFDYSTVG